MAPVFGSCDAMHVGAYIARVAYERHHCPRKRRPAVICVGRCGGALVGWVGPGFGHLAFVGFKDTSLFLLYMT
jgi:hypothetical protein